MSPLRLSPVSAATPQELDPDQRIPELRDGNLTAVVTGSSARFWRQRSSEGTVKYARGRAPGGW